MCLIVLAIAFADEHDPSSDTNDSVKDKLVMKAIVEVCWDALFKFILKKVWLHMF